MKTAAVRRPGILLLALLLVAAACGFASDRTVIPRPSSRQPVWIVVASALVRLRALPGGAALAASAFGNAQTFVIVGPHPPAFLAGWKSPRAISVGGYAPLEKRLAAGPLPAGLRAVVLDQEAWPFTPAEERRHPGRYAKLAATLVHRRGLLLVATPATDLAKSSAKGQENQYAAFLAARFAARVAPWADYYEVQAQGLEGNPAAYGRFVAAAAAQARRSNPRVVVLAGLSTNPPGDPQVSAAALHRDVQATRGLVAGYWLNIPGPSAYCPRCGAPRPEVAFRLLSRLRQTHG